MPVPDGAVDGYIAWMLLLGSDISEGVDGERRNRIPQGGVEMRTSLVFIEVLYLHERRKPAPCRSPLYVLEARVVLTPNAGTLAAASEECIYRQSMR